MRLSILDVFNLISRSRPIFIDAIAQSESAMCAEIKRSKFLVIGGAGTIGQAVVMEIYSRQPQLIDVVDISENNLVELVRDIRSSYGYISGICSSNRERRPGSGIKSIATHNPGKIRVLCT